VKRRVLALCGAGLFVLAVAAPTAAAGPTGAVVVREVYQCIVGWDEASGDLSTGAYDESCLVTNVLQPNGTFTQVLHGQIPADQMDAFRAAGSPSSYATGCLVNYGWLAKYHGRRPRMPRAASSTTAGLRSTTAAKTGPG